MQREEAVSPITGLGQRRVVMELEGVVAELLNRHAGLAREWFPHEYIPWHLGEDFDRQPWAPDQPQLNPIARVAFEVNLVTEDNLPSYHRVACALAESARSPWYEWA